MIKNNHLKAGPVLSTLALFIITTPSFAGSQPTFSILPKTATTFEVPANGNSFVQYQITNNSKITRTATMVPISAINQITAGTGACSNPFVLAPQQSCLLNLQLSGGQLAQQITDGPVVCKTNSNSNNSPDPYLCSRPSAQNSLNITPTSAVFRNAVAVGFTNISGSKPLAYSTSDIGYTWSNPVLPQISGATGILYGTACDSSGLRCIAVGTKTISGVIYATSYNTIDGGNNWTETSPLSPSASDTPVLLGVACDSSGIFCTATGYYDDALSNRYNLIYTTNNGGNSWNSFIDPGEVSNSTDNSLNAVACDNTGAVCTTIGSALDGSGSRLLYSFTTRNYGVTWNGPTLLPSSADTTQANLSGIACDSTGLHCTTVGGGPTAGQTNVGALTFTTTDGGNSWSNAIQPIQPAGGIYAYLNSVSCSTNGLLCTAVGQVNLNGTLVPLSYTSPNGGKTWSLPRLPNPPVGGTNSTLASVSCDNSGLICTAVGYTTIATAQVPLSYTTINGGFTWSKPILPTKPAGSTNSRLLGVAGSR